MAKEDFCFTYYDGDAARDMQHMDRLTRGAYNDLVIMQRKVEGGMLSINHIKAVLGSDFNACWFALEIVLKKSGELFFIEWVRNSVEKSKRHSEKQSLNGKSGGRPKIESEVKPKHNPNDNQKKPLGNGYGYEDEIEDEKKGGTGKNKTLVRCMEIEFKKFNTDYPTDEEKDYPALLKIAKFIGQKIEKPFDVNEDFKTAMMPYWSHLCEHIPKDSFFKNYSISQVEKHIQSIVQTVQNGSNTNQKSNSKITANGLKQAFDKYSVVK